MSNTGREPSRREYTESEQDQSFIGRRMKAFADRSREPGDATTWAVVLGALMSTLLMICFAVAGHSMLALTSFGLAAVWVFVVSHFGRVNVFSVLWGAATTDSTTEPEHLVIYRATAVLSAISIIAVLIDAATGWGFTWYGVALIAVVIAYIGVVYHPWIASIR